MATNELVRRQGGTSSTLQERVEKLESFTTRSPTASSTKQELTGAGAAAGRGDEEPRAELSDELHAKVTTVLVELTAYNVMRLLHELQAERARVAFGKA